MVPYYFTFTTFTKGRWVGETILTVFSREFRAQPRHEYVSWRIQNTNLILLSKWHSLLSADFEEAFSVFLIISISVTAKTFNVDIFFVKRINSVLPVPAWKRFDSFIFQERCINAGTLTVNFEKVPVDYKLKHNDLLANIVHRYIYIILTLLGLITLWQYPIWIWVKFNAVWQSIMFLVVSYDVSIQTFLALFKKWMWWCGGY